MMNKFFFLTLLTLLASCYRVPDTIEPRVSLKVEQKHIDSLSSPFEKLTPEERAEDWGKEYAIALKFGETFDLYRAITTFKRANALLEDEDSYRKSEIAYFTIFSYYLGKRYHDAIHEFENSILINVDQSFKPYHDLMLILYECYMEVGDIEKGERIQELFRESYPETYEKMRLSVALKEGDLPIIEEYADEKNAIKPLLNTFEERKKSVFTAQSLNALIPGMGYLYVGQKKSAISAFLLNGLFIYASYYFFQKGNIAAGVVTTSFECGWYFGGIYGAGESAKYYNERLYEKQASPMMNAEKRFPVFMLHYGF